MSLRHYVNELPVTGGDYITVILNSDSTSALLDYSTYVLIHCYLYQWNFSGTPNIGTPFPYYSHTAPIRIPKDMVMVWEAYHKAVPLLGVPEISLDYIDTSHLYYNCL